MSRAERANLARAPGTSKKGELQTQGSFT